ncbi:MAG: Sulfatase-modifying factor 1 [Frankiales bacterium]|nr:Sulfatase-modifying factor 1 [Frankiales bacterium]
MTFAKDMVRITGGRFLMGSEDFYPEEKPAHVAEVAGFLLDAHPVTNLEFGRFVRQTGYLTVAERRPTGPGLEDADPADLVPGSLVFQQASGPIALDDWRRWWIFAPGASWRTPQGPGSSLAGRDQHPVVHVAYEDALAYAEWVGKRLPTETEWEYAARAGRPPTTFAWGEERTPRGRMMANTWHGQFPWENLNPTGRASTTAVGRYRANDWGLVDMIGNVWEWTDSTWTPDHHPSPEPTGPIEPMGELQPTGEPASHSCCGVSRSEPLAEDDRRVIKGGSHLCSPSYCLRYRPPARQGQTVRSSTSHIGFRCAAN